MLAARERTGWGPRLIAGETGVAHSTVHAILKRHGRSRVPRPTRAAFRRYEWPCPGDLLHMDVKRYPRFRRPGHAMTGDRRRVNAQRANPLGHDYFHAVVDESSLPVLVDVWAPWCGPCRMVSPALEQLAGELAGNLKLVKVNADDNPAVSRRFEVQSIPTLVLLRGPLHLDQLSGALGKDALSSWLDRYV